MWLSITQVMFLSDLRDILCCVDFCLNLFRNMNDSAGEVEVESCVLEALEKSGKALWEYNELSHKDLIRRFKDNHWQMNLSIAQLKTSLDTLRGCSEFEAFELSFSVLAAKVVVSGLKNIELTVKSVLIVSPAKLSSRVNFPPEIKFELFALIECDRHSIAVRKKICERTGLTLTQVNNWIWTQRSRMKSKRQKLDTPYKENQHLGNVGLLPPLCLEVAEDPFLPRFESEDDKI